MADSPTSEDRASLKPGNLIQEQNMDMVRALRQVARNKTKKRGYRTGIGALSLPSFVSGTFGPMMQSKKLYRTNNDIRTAVNLWCTNRAEAEERYGHISDWDVSSVTDMSELFYGKRTFNDDISRWDVSKVTNMSYMFCGAFAFNQDIGGWNVSNVTGMYLMFMRAESFNQDLTRWNVNRVITSKLMDLFRFVHCPISNANKPAGFRHGGANAKKTRRVRKSKSVKKTRSKKSRRRISRRR